jgi:hypothetical protein
MLRVIRRADVAMRAAVTGGAPVEEAGAAPSVTALARMREWPDEHVDERAAELIEDIERELEASDDAAVHH